jgi:hypothetical protein
MLLLLLLAAFASRSGLVSSLEECETTGYETRVREECEEVSEIDCTRYKNVTRYKTEIATHCRTVIDKTCHVTWAVGCDFI